MNHLIIPAWGTGKKFLFRFFCAWFIIYILPFPLDSVPFVTELSSWSEKITAWYLSIFTAYTNMWHAIIPWLAKHVLHLSYPITIFSNGSGDTTYDYVLLLTDTFLALLISVVWTLLDKKRRSYAMAYDWLRVLVRYYLALNFFGYGFAKVFHLQMPFPYLSQLVQPFGEKSPMGIAWSFIGYSPAFSAITGWAEVICGAFLFFRRTTTLGALLGMVVMGNIVAINFCYDVPVKLFSSMLFIMCTFLILPDLGRLLNILVFNRHANPVVQASFVSRRKHRLILSWLKAVFILYTVYSNVSGSIKGKKEYGDDRKLPPLYGIYNTSSFILAGDTIKPLTTDTVRWKQLVIQFEKNAQLRFMSDSTRYYSFIVDTPAHKISLYPYSDTLHKSTLYYQADSAWLTLTGKLKNDSVKIRLKKFNIQSFRLVRTGFHWINEYPYNR